MEVEDKFIRRVQRERTASRNKVITQENLDVKNSLESPLKIRCYRPVLEFLAFFSSVRFMP